MVFLSRTGTDLHGIVQTSQLCDDKIDGYFRRENAGENGDRQGLNGRQNGNKNTWKSKAEGRRRGRGGEEGEGESEDVRSDTGAGNFRLPPKPYAMLSLNQRR